MTTKPKPTAASKADEQPAAAADPHHAATDASSRIDLNDPTLDDREAVESNLAAQSDD